MKNILVTGAAGYIGSVVCKAAKEAGHNVVGVDLKRIEHGYCHERIEGRTFEEAFRNPTKRYDSVYHLAASASVPDSVSNPREYYENNSVRTISMVMDMITMGWKGNLIFSSTAAVYGDAITGPFHEHDRLVPCNPYGVSKLMCEQVIEDMVRTKGLRAAVFRYFNVVGADGDLGDHLDSSHVLQKLCYSAVNDQPFNMYGCDLDTRDGTCVRDYVDVRDVARAHLYVDGLLDYRINPAYEAYNIGSRNGTTVAELVSMFEEVSGKKINVVRRDKRLGDPDVLIADVDKLLYTGFKYRYNKLDMISSAWEYYRRATNGI